MIAASFGCFNGGQARGCKQVRRFPASLRVDLGGNRAAYVLAELSIENATGHVAGRDNFGGKEILTMNIAPDERERTRNVYVFDGVSVAAFPDDEFPGRDENRSFRRRLSMHESIEQGSSLISLFLQIEIKARHGNREERVLVRTTDERRCCGDLLRYHQIQ